jgi:hypothetical protein
MSYKTVQRLIRRVLVGGRIHKETLAKLIVLTFKTDL